MSRRKGFSLVELLIVLAVIAALIATITPVALNAIRKAKATQVAQNLKTLASALENAAYVNGVVSNKIRSSSGDITLADLGRDINGKEYAVYYTGTSGNYTVTIVSLAEAAIGQVKTALKDAFTTTWSSAGITGYEPLTSNWTTPNDTDEVIAYTFTFNVY